MKRLIAELERLYFLPAQRGGYAPASGVEGAASLGGKHSSALPLVGDDGGVRTLTVEFARAADWPQVGALYQALQSDLQLPAAALAIGGGAAYSLWISLAEPVPGTVAEAFLAALRANYLADLPPAALALRPAGAEPSRLALLPAPQGANGRWSAFIDPSLGAMFSDEPWLEMAPNIDKQADLLARLASVGRDDWRRALALLAARAAPVVADAGGTLAPDADGDAGGVRTTAATARSSPPSSRKGRRTLSLGGDFADPVSFLRALMNDSSADVRDRIAAAKALLPYRDPRPA
jgi:hypothetical protein